MLSAKSGSVASSNRGVFFDAFNSAGEVTEARIIIDTIPSNMFKQSAGDYSMFPSIQKLLVQTDTVGAGAFTYAFKGPKVKIKSKNLNAYCFTNVATAKFWLSDDVENISAPSYTYSPFYNSSASLYCEAEAKKDGWGNYWNYSGRGSVQPTMWGVSEEQFDALE